MPITVNIPCSVRIIGIGGGINPPVNILRKFVRAGIQQVVSPHRDI